MIPKMLRSATLLRQSSARFAQVARRQASTPARRERLQFGKQRLVDFGELPHGEIPDALHSLRPSSFNKLSNQVRVVSESWIAGQTSITVLVKAGSRQENLSNSSVANFVAHAARNGTGKYSKDKVEELIESMSGELKVEVYREISEFTLTFDAAHLAQAVDLLSEIVLNPTYDATEVEALKPAIHKRASPMDPYEVTREAVHYTAFRDHYIGQPATGNKDVVYSINGDQIREYHNNFYVGSNIVISGAGNINSDALLNEVSSSHFAKVPAERISEVPNSEQPYFTPSLLYQRDDEMLNTAFSVAFQAPRWGDPDHFALMYFKRVIGEYRCDKYTGEHLNSAHLQYNHFHTWMGNHPDMIMQRPYYFAYSDTGLFGNFIYGNQMYTQEMSVITQNFMSCYAQDINQAEVFRARNKLFNDLLERNDPANVSFLNSRQTAYLDRLVDRTEIATRCSHMTGDYLKQVATRWFWDKQNAVTAWGNLHSGVINAHYNRTFRRATLGKYSQVAVNMMY